MLEVLYKNNRFNTYPHLLIGTMWHRKQRVAEVGYGIFRVQTVENGEAHIASVSGNLAHLQDYRCAINTLFADYDYLGHQSTLQWVEKNQLVYLLAHPVFTSEEDDPQERNGRRRSNRYRMTADYTVWWTNGGIGLIGQVEDGRIEVVRRPVSSIPPSVRDIRETLQEDLRLEASLRANSPFSSATEGESESYGPRRRRRGAPREPSSLECQIFPIPDFLYLFEPIPDGSNLEIVYGLQQGRRNGERGRNLAELSRPIPPVPPASVEKITIRKPKSKKASEDAPNRTAFDHLSGDEDNSSG